MLLLMLMGVIGVKAQTYIVTVGDQVTTAAGVEDNGLYALYNPRNGKWMYEDSSHKLLLNGGLAFDGLNGSTTTNAVFRLISNGDGTYKIQAYDTERYLPAPTGNQNISTSETAGNYALNIQSDGNMFPRCTNNGTTYGLDHTSAGVYAYTSLNMTNGSAQNYRLYKITLTEYVEPEGISIVTLNNTNTSRGALIYNPSASEKWVWSSGKSGTFNSSNANSQWVFYPTGDDGEYYLYNLGAQKFAVPTLSGGYNGYSWMFSHDAVAVTLNEQSDGTYKIFTANGSICMSVSNGYTGPIINYNDVGAQFAMTKLEEIGETLIQEIETAIGKLIHKTTPLTAAPTGDGWYAIRVKTHETYADQFVFTAEDEINYNGTYYPLDFYSAAKVRPAIDNSIYYAKLTKSAYGHYWQMPNGRYIQNSKPISGAGESSITGITYDATNGFTIKSSSYYFVPYLLGGVYFIGETGSAGKAYYDIYPISITDAGLTAWQVLCDDAPDTQEITCTRDDVKGLTSVYKNGYFFLPVDAATPTSDDFSMPGAINYIVNSTDKTVTIEYDPSLAIVAEGVEVHQGYGTTGLGNEKAVLLRMQVTPFNAMENAVMTFTLTNPDNISAVKVYETGNNVEFNAISSYTHTFNGTINGTAATVTLGNVTAGTHYYWLCATVASDATVGDVIDAALTGVTYDYNGYTGTTCDLSAVGNPSNSMKIFDKQQYLFLPTTYNSNYYRIPALITTDNGTLIAACDKRYNSSSDLGSHKIDVVMRRSTDGGATWSEVATIAVGDGSSNAAYGYGDPAFVKCVSGKIICLMAAGKNSFWQGMSNIAMVTSDDDGENWSSPIDITTNTGHFTNNSSKSDWFVTSGKGLCTSDGVIMFLLDADYNAETNLVLYSVDEGVNWIIDDAVVATGANEAKLVELEPGKLLSSTRNPGNRIFNTGTFTKNTNDCDFTWDTQTTNSTLNQGGSGNNQDIIVYSRNNDGSAKVLIHTLTTGYGHKTLKLFLSLDKGESWNEVMQVQPGGSRYAVTTILDNGDLGILFEDYSLETGKEYPINFLTITQEQINEWVEELEQVDYDFDANFDKTFIIKNYNSGVNNPYIQSPKYNAAGDVKAYRTADINKSAEMLILKDHQNEGFYYVYDVKSNFYLKSSVNMNAGTEWTFSTTPVTVKLTDHTSNHSGWTLTDGHIFLIQNSDGSMANAYEGSYGTQVKNWTDDSDKGSHWYIYATENSTTSAVYVDPTALYYIKNVSVQSYFETGEVGNLSRNGLSTAATYAIIPVSGQAGYYYLYDTKAQNFVVSEENTGDGGQWTRSTTTPTVIKIKNNITNQYMDRSAWNPSGIIYLLGSKYANAYQGGTSGYVRNYNAQSDKGSHWYLERVDNSTAAVVEMNGITDHVESLVNSGLAAGTQLQYTAKLNAVGNASWATLYVPFDLAAVDNTMAYYVDKVEGDEANLIEIGDGNIPTTTAVVLKNTDVAEEVTFSVTQDLPSVVSEQANMLKGTTTSMELNLGDDTPYYSLGRLNGAIGFYKYKSNGSSTITLGANKAYLDTTVPVNSSKGFRLVFNDNDDPNDPVVSDDGGFVDGINEVHATGEDVFYNLNGSRVNTPRKGIYIVNGKKVVVVNNR